MDILTAEQRSKRMAAVRQKHTSPELHLRRMLHAAGYRFRLHRRDLPGTPDIVLPRLRKAIFVNGCFWHGHDCRAGRRPSNNPDYWNTKIDANVRRDQRKVAELQELGWAVTTVWECELRKTRELPDALKRFLATAQ